jgi:cytochrome c oxidase subunit 2
MKAPSFSALHPAGVQSERIAELFVSYTCIAIVVFLAVAATLFMAVTRQRRAEDEHKREFSGAARAARNRVVSVATLITVVALVAMLVLSVNTTRALASLKTDDALSVKVTGRKWWWEFTYPASVGGTEFTTAYEMHVPVGRAVQIDLTSADVIHSFWVPSLNGKRDAIPGKHQSILLRADRVGRYEGQCAEFCGVQHANMRFAVVAEGEEDFKAWVAHALTPGTVPKDPVERRGQEVFVKSRCAACHSIGGTEAFATVGPNLTHFASRSHIGMGTLPNTRDHLRGWIADPQSTKPGVMMPATALDGDDLNALVTYLGSLR